MWCFPEHGCGVLVRLRCMRVRVVPIPSVSLPLFYLQTRRSETFGELTMRTVKLFHDTKEVRWMITTDLVQSHLSWSRRRIFDLPWKNAHGFNFVQIWPIFWAETLAPDDLQNKPLSRPLTAKKGYNHVVQTSGYNEGRWEWHRSCLCEFIERSTTSTPILPTLAAWPVQATRLSLVEIWLNTRPPGLGAGLESSGQIRYIYGVVHKTLVKVRWARNRSDFFPFSGIIKSGKKN